MAEDAPVQPLPVPDDFDAYWRQVATEAEALPLQPVPFDWAPGGEAQPAGVRFQRVRLEGLGGVPVGGVLALPDDPPGLARRLPALVHFAGYGGESILHQDLVAAGFAVFDFSHRGMKWGLAAFDRDRPRPLLARDVEDPERYVYRAIYADCLLAVRYVRGLDAVDPARVAVLGTSQGGGLAIGVGALVQPAAVAADIPWLTHFARQLALPVEGPYNELKDLLARRPDLRPAALRTLAYFDTTSLATRLTAPTFVSLGQADVVCPPDSVRAMFGRIPGCKSLLEVPGLGHARSAIWRRLALAWMQTWV